MARIRGPIPFFSYVANADIPIVIVSAHELEGFIAVASDQADVGGRLLHGIRDRGDEVPSINRPVGDLPGRPNSILGSAWDEFMEPVTGLDPTAAAAAEAALGTQ